MIFEIQVRQMSSGALVDKAIFDIQVPISLPELFYIVLPMLDEHKPKMALAIKETESFDMKNVKNFLCDDNGWKTAQIGKTRYFLGTFNSKYRIEVFPHHKSED